MPPLPDWIRFPQAIEPKSDLTTFAVRHYYFGTSAISAYFTLRFPLAEGIPRIVQLGSLCIRATQGLGTGNHDISEVESRGRTDPD